MLGGAVVTFVYERASSAPQPAAVAAGQGAQAGEGHSAAEPRGFSALRTARWPQLAGGVLGALSLGGQTGAVAPLGAVLLNVLQVLPVVPRRGQWWPYPGDHDAQFACQ